MKKIIVVLIFIFAVVTICCSQKFEIANGMQLYNISGEIYNDSSCEIITNSFLSEKENEYIYKNCKIKNGKLFISIPKIIKDEYLYQDNNPGWFNMIKSTMFGISCKDSIGTAYISLGIKSNDESSIENRITIFYSDSDATVTIPSLWDGKFKDVNYKKGWNIIVWMYSEIYYDIQALYDKGYKWYIFYYK